MASIGEALTGLFAAPKQGFDSFRKSGRVEDRTKMSEEWPIAPQAYADDRRFLPQSHEFLDDLLTLAHIYSTRMAPFPEGPTDPLAEKLGASDIRTQGEQ